MIEFFSYKKQKSNRRRKGVVSNDRGKIILSTKQSSKRIAQNHELSRVLSVIYKFVEISVFCCSNLKLFLFSKNKN